MEDYDRLLDLAAELGCRLMSSGAEIYRVEESMRRLLEAYRLDTAEVFTIPSCVIVSATTPEGHPVTRMRRIPAHGTDLELLERCNSLCRSLCATPPPLEEARARVDALPDRLPRYRPKQILLGYVIAPAFFVPLFGDSLIGKTFDGGNGWELAGVMLSDALCAALCGLAVGVCVLYGKRLLGANGFFHTAVCSASASLSALLLTGLGLGRHVDVVTISVLMMLVPGVALTNAMREIMAGDTISGLARAADAVLTAGAIALGSAAGLAIAQTVA
ncbi:MAG: threonine/serine exporter family protein [Oscillibacter sp.]|nr:threonine/serine exporter family protein [Oscillibacter sp.]